MNPSSSHPIRPVILVVDDTPDNLLLMANLLKDSYTVKAANNGEKALRIARDSPPPDLILLDIMMPGMTGHEVAQVLQSDPATRDIPIIFLTAMASSADETHGLELGAADYITKPISPPVVLARVRTQLKVKDAADFLRDKNDYLEQEVQRRTRELERDPRCHDPRHGLAGRDARQRDRQPHPPHPALRQGAGRTPARASALPRFPRPRHHQAVV